MFVPQANYQVIPSFYSMLLRAFSWTQNSLPCVIFSDVWVAALGWYPIQTSHWPASSAGYVFVLVWLSEKNYKTWVSDGLKKIRHHKINNAQEIPLCLDRHTTVSFQSSVSNSSYFQSLTGVWVTLRNWWKVRSEILIHWLQNEAWK
jgi:hypothetical protein